MLDYSFSLVDFEYFLLVLVRISTFIFVAPFFSHTSVPNRVKISLAFVVSIMVSSVLAPTEATSYESMFGYSIFVIREAAVGLLIGYAASLCNYIILFAGNVIDMDIGLSMAQEFDPSLHTQVTMTGQLYYYGIGLLLITSGMYQYLLRAVIDSFTLIPLGGAIFNWDALLYSMVKFMTNLIIIAFRICLPVFGCIMIMNCILGVMAKVAPQMNMFSVGIQIKILVGFAIILITIFLFGNVGDFIFRQMQEMMVSFIEGMM